MGHVIGWNEEVAGRLRSEPGEMIPLVRSYSSYGGNGRVADSLCLFTIILPHSTSIIWHLTRSVRNRVEELGQDDHVSLDGQRDR